MMIDSLNRHSTILLLSHMCHENLRTHRYILKKEEMSALFNFQATSLEVDDFYFTFLFSLYAFYTLSM